MIASIPATATWIYATGKTVILQTAPVDPYSPLLGYSQTLSYDVSRWDNLEKLGKMHSIDYIKRGKPIYIILEAPAQAGNPWRPVAIQLEKPNSLPVNQLALRGQPEYGQIRYGLETYYIPEGKIQDINREFEQIRRGLGPDSRPPIWLEARVGADGQAVPVALIVRDRRYTY
jgi:uncharacterized membrane-anchored protein